jgi:phage virion morphogenesis protein
MSGGITMEARIDDHALMAYLAKVENRCIDMTPAMKAIGEYMLRATDQRFTDEEDPEGKAWTPHAAITRALAYRRKGGKTHTAKRKQVSAAFLRYAASRKILTEGHYLRRSIHYVADRDSVVIGTPPDIPYAAIHQFGGKAGRGKKVKIPARPYLGINDRDRAKAVQIMKQYIGMEA